MTSEFVMLYKDTSLLSSVGVMELMLFSKNLTATTGNITPYICAAPYYLVVTIPLIHVVAKVEHRLAKRGKRQPLSRSRTQQSSQSRPAASPNVRPWFFGPLGAYAPSRSKRLA